jgi:hemerythrin-like domain-containing protein
MKPSICIYRGMAYSCTDSGKLSVTSDLKKDHLFVRRLGVVLQRCSDRLYPSEDIPSEDIEIACVIMEEFVDGFHHGKEENAYFPVTKDKNSFSEDIRKTTTEKNLEPLVNTRLLTTTQNTR